MENLKKGDRVTSNIFKSAIVRKSTALGHIEVEFKDDKGNNFIRLVPKETVKKLN